MRGLELLHPPDARTHPELGALCVQIDKKWPELLAPVMVAWSERPVVAIDDSGVPWIYGDAPRVGPGRTGGSWLRQSRQKQNLGCVPFKEADSLTEVSQ